MESLLTKLYFLQMKKHTFGAFILIGLLCSSCGTMLPAGSATGANTNTTATNSPANQTDLGGILGNVLGSVLGNVTTTKANLIGTWTYTEPSVQFESENLLKKAGGAAAANKVEAQLASVYKKVGITPGKLIFTFSDNGQVTYKVGNRSMNGTYVFDSNNKQVKITTSSGITVNAYVTISINSLSRCFDSTKLLPLINTVGSISGSSILGSIGQVADSFSGMKTGFKFTK